MMSNVIDFRRHRDARRYEDAVAEQEARRCVRPLPNSHIAHATGDHDAAFIRNRLDERMASFAFTPSHPPEKPRWRQEIGDGAVLALAFALGALAACGSIVALAWLVTELQP